MRKLIITIIACIGMGFIGYILGKDQGYRSGYLSCEANQKFRSIELIKADLADRERQNISDYINGKAGIKNINKGGWLKSKYVQYFQGELVNSALLVSAKDVTLNVDFYSKTGTKIGNQEIVIYEFVKPGSTIKFKEKINVPDKVDEVKFQIVDVKAE